MSFHKDEFHQAKKYVLEIYMPEYNKTSLWSFNPIYPEEDKVWTGSLSNAKKLKKLLEELAGTEQPITIIEVKGSYLTTGFWRPKDQIEKLK